MIFVGILFLIFVPYLLGTLETMVLRERNASHINVYVTGLLSLFAYFLLVVLASLKLDMSLRGMEKLFFFPVLLLAFVSGMVLSYKGYKGYFEKRKPFGRDCLWFVPTAVLLGFTAFFMTEPSYANDASWEFVKTALFTDSYYKYSAFTGKELINNLPIFAKIYIMPLWYTVFCDTFGFEMWQLAGIIFPVIFYSLNLLIINAIAKEILPGNKRRQALFMCVYLIYLLAGTYLPKGGITATVGFALLREGYTGYAAVYGIVIPFVIWMFLQKKYLHGILCLSPVLGLLPLDKLFFTWTKGLFSYVREINVAGKLAALYLCALAVTGIFAYSKKEKTPAPILAAPYLIVCYVIVRLSDFISGKKERIAYFLGIAFIILSACNFRPMNDAVYAKNIYKENLNLKHCLEEVTKNGSVCILSQEEIMSEVRRLNSKATLAFSRSEYETGLWGIEYEEMRDEAYILLDFMKNKTYRDDYLTLQKSDHEIMKIIIGSGVDCIIIPADSCRTDFEELMQGYGFFRKGNFSNYIAYTLYKDAMLNNR